MATVNPYLNFNGNTEDAFNFYKSVFGGEFLTLQRFIDTPHADACCRRTNSDAHSKRCFGAHTSEC
jgi:uncharacterized glyoxalase superfamily protein PhnB